MTDPRRPGGRGTALVLLPAVAAVFGGSLAWAVTHEPLATAQAGPTATVQAHGSPDQATIDALTAQVQAAQERLTALEAMRAGQDTDGARQSVAPAPAAPAPAPASPPPVHVTTKASG